MNLLISGAVVCNGGDAAIMEAQLRLLGEHIGNEDRVVIHDLHPEVAPTVFPDRQFEPSWHTRLIRRYRLKRLTRYWRALHEFRILLAARLMRRGIHPLGLTSRSERGVLNSASDVDVVIYSGGTSLIEQYPVAAKIFDLELASIFGAAVVLMTQSLGPFA